MLAVEGREGEAPAEPSAALGLLPDNKLLIYF